MPVTARSIAADRGPGGCPGTAVPVPRSVVTLTTCSGPDDGVAGLVHGGPDGGVGEPVPVDGERAGQRHLDGAHAGDLGDLLIDRRDAVPARHPGDLIDLFGHDLLLTLAGITSGGICPQPSSGTRPGID